MPRSIYRTAAAPDEPPPVERGFGDEAGELIVLAIGMVLLGGSVIAALVRREAFGADLTLELLIAMLIAAGLWEPARRALQRILRQQQ